MTNRERLLDWLVRLLAERRDEDLRQADQDARGDTPNHDSDQEKTHEDQD